MVSLSGGSTAFGAAAIVLVLLLVVLWFVMGTAAVLRSESVEPPNRFAQMYGYTMCLVAVIVGLSSLAAILDAAFDRTHPLQTDYTYGVSLTSFETYRATRERERAAYGPQAAEPSPDTSSDATLKRRYDALVADRLASTNYRTSKAFVTSGIMFL
ncbi:MAG: hypothetical protein ACREMA_19185, partial [Longimicrobiales bacterium]